MSEPIKVGDLVMVVKSLPCCKSGVTLGLIFKAVFVGNNGKRNRCHNCNAVFPPSVTVADASNTHWTPSRLIKIDPPAQGETREAYKELTT